ncbi:hypothetical protein [Pseudomonas fluorescens]|uniref:hypothetical protein n=1 Tax=Pseudomonas fluorescens TaxID=294 RepID=UPI00381ECD78
MTRRHTLLPLREVEHLVARLAVEFEYYQEHDLDYQMDLEFFQSLKELMARYGYTAQQAADIIREFIELEDGLGSVPAYSIEDIFAETKKISATCPAGEV